MANLLMKNIGMIATAQGDCARRAQQQGEIATYHNAYIAV